MKNYSQCIGKEITEVASGNRLSNISDIIFDTEKGILKAIVNSENNILYLKDISEWKLRIYIKDSILFKNLDECKDIQKILNKNISILGSRVENEDGVFLGYCENFYFNEKTGYLVQIYIKYYFLNIFPIKKLLISATEIIEITEKKIIVKSTNIQDALPDI